MNTTSINWFDDATFYHIYPLGLCGAPARNDFSSPPVERLSRIGDWIPHLQSLGVDALYLGPLFSSSTHGYDTADYYHVDQRLGTNETLARLVQQLHAAGIRVVLDGVFNHVGRDFWAFRDVRQNGESSRYVNWFQGIRFGVSSPMGDPFTYETWNGHYELVRLNLHNPETRQHILEAVRHWMVDFGIDGLRLDVADCLDLDFQRELADFTRTLRPDFWLMGEVIHGDYRQWANPDILHSVTNYECYKGLYSSLVDRNYFEIAYALNRQFGEGGIYRHMQLYNFVDNHDVDRVASKLNNPQYLPLVYGLLFTMPGIPSIYYGSEWGIQGGRTSHSDADLRPALDIRQAGVWGQSDDLLNRIQKLAHLRKSLPALRLGGYRQLAVQPQQLAFSRELDGEVVIAVFNAADEGIPMELRVPYPNGTQFVDRWNQDEVFGVADGKICMDAVPPYGMRILCTHVSYKNSPGMPGLLCGWNDLANGNWGNSCLALPVQVFHDVTDHKLTSRSIELLPGECLAAKGQGLSFLLNHLGDVALRVQVHPAIQDGEGVSHLGDDFARRSGGIRAGKPEHLLKHAIAEEHPGVAGIGVGGIGVHSFHHVDGFLAGLPIDRGHEQGNCSGFAIRQPVENRLPLKFEGEIGGSPPGVIDAVQFQGFGDVQVVAVGNIDGIGCGIQQAHQQLYVADVFPADICAQDD